MTRPWGGKGAARRKLPLILQSETTECGVACVAMIAGYHGFIADMMLLRRRFGASSRGVDIRALIEIASDLNMAARALRLEPEEIGELVLPCVVHWQMNHFVVLKTVTARGVVIHDPGAGERHLSHAEFNRSFTGVALELTPTPEFKPAKYQQKLSFRDFWSRITGLRRAAATVLALSLLLQLFAIASPLFLQIAVDEVVTRNTEGILLGLALGFGLLMLLQTAVATLRQFVVLHLQCRLNMQMGANLFRHLIRLPLDYFIKRHVGDIVSRFGSLEQVREILANSLVTALVDGLMATLTLVAMFWYDARLAGVVIATVVLYGLLRWYFFKPLKLATQEAILARAGENSHFLESVRAVQTIKLFQKENDRLSQWQNRLADTLGKELKIAGWYARYGTLNALLFGVENLLVICIAVGAIQSGGMTLGMLYAFIAYKLRFIDSMDSLVSNAIEFRMLDVHFERLSDIVYSTPEKTESSLASDGRDIVGAIEVRNLGFRYGDRDPFIFRNVSFRIEAGESVAIVGPSGCGKTTLLKCLLGLLVPSEGSILVDGVDIREVPQYRARIAAVMQEDQLLSGSIGSNIACFDPQIDQEKVARCAKLAGIEPDIRNMPMQFDTLVGDLGTTLSGGQKQRILLARALYREPRLLFMDEATSHLDVGMEARVNRNVGALNITRVLVAHRPETVRSAGKRIELSVDETGTMLNSITGEKNA
jgi:ATP-binding cassette, subfamily B, bacterial CvaB/MchF/RaxB